jgi:aminomethyltransferase
LLDIDFVGATPDRPGAKFDPATADGTPAQPAVGILPAELGPATFARAVDLSKCYIGQEVVARMHARKQVARQICGIRMNTEALPLAGAKVFDDADNEVGVVTSSTMSPVLSNAAICLAYVKKPFFEIGKAVRIPAEGALAAGVVVELPFVDLAER